MDNKFDLFLLSDLWVYDLSNKNVSNEDLDRIKRNYNVLVLEWAIDGTVHLVGRFNVIQFIIIEDLKINLDNELFKPLMKIYNN